jgi:hypothetical protein
VTRAAIFAALLACGSRPPQHVEIAPLPSHEEPARSASLDELGCKPRALEPVDIDRLGDALAGARDFAQRCCSGDESGDATVHVTASPSGYQTRIDIEPENLSAGATGACVHAVFHRVIIRPFEGAEKTESVVVRLR